MDFICCTLQPIGGGRAGCPLCFDIAREAVINGTEILPNSSPQCLRELLQGAGAGHPSQGSAGRQGDELGLPGDLSPQAPPALVALP